MKQVTKRKRTISPQQYLTQTAAELGRLAVFAKAYAAQPVVVLIDKRSPWVTKTKRLLAEILLHSGEHTTDGFLKGCSDWKICEIAAKSAPTIAKNVLTPPEEPSHVRIVMFYETRTGLRIACTDLHLSEYFCH